MTISQLSKQIHLKESKAWQIGKSLEGVAPYCFRFKKANRPVLMLKLKREAKELRTEREKLKLVLPKELWYPRYKRCGRYNSTEQEIKTRIMCDAYEAGFNVKQIAGYFRLSLGTVYYHVNVKTFWR